MNGTDVKQIAASGTRRVLGLKRDPLAHLGVLQRAILLRVLESDEPGGVSVRSIVRSVAHHNATLEDIG